MALDPYEQTLLKLLCAETYFSCQMTASREMYAKSYFSLGVAEKQAVDQTVLGSIGAILSQITPEWLGVADPKQRGFQPPNLDTPYQPSQPSPESNSSS